MKIIDTGSGILLADEEYFDPFISFECGQCFRFEKISESEYVFCALGKRIGVKAAEGGYLFTGVTADEFKNGLVGYFDLERDYGAIIKALSADENIARAVKYCSGIRIFRQDPWEALASFIISQNNNIPRIKKIINALCVTLCGDERIFPAPELLLEAGSEGLAPIRAGFRVKYLLDAAEKTVSGEIYPEHIRTLPYEEALAALKSIKGVGDKVANCVLLFGYGFTEAFPVDVWVKKVIGEYYGDDFTPKRFGKYAGFAQQYLFCYERSFKSKVRGE